VRSDTLRSLMESVAIDVEVVPEANSQLINTPDDWRVMILSSGYRGTVDQVSPSEREQVRADLDFIRHDAIHSESKRM